MRIEELVLEGFKSYPVRTQITGWDTSFNAITGLNGSGKSNILDAICFVLGITNMTSVRTDSVLFTVPFAYPRQKHNCIVLLSQKGYLKRTIANRPAPPTIPLSRLLVGDIC